ncbi:4-hydroxybenzoate octaprenyltransferase [Botrimarina hoheduenensis]|uniref:4-hydroxybenzoate polyprenyltransferase n=1 Tax=Botrimarina hoheduenensis TaxID=2528000 RepID=A0A5C5W0S0_9BACT|nr:4-hydroxybenzoate octaprenyltransferase [Botrimarina hoheduenensis]TWT43372.1 4-hydroxybenzoate octaprenyltransferase [Botrimarina hoheduenensis]
MFQTLRHLLSLIRFSHTLFALPFALLAALMAWHEQAFSTAWTDYAPFSSTTGFKGFGVRWKELFGILLCMVFARSAAMAFNRLVDRKLDAANPRTMGRHLPAGILSVTQVTTFTLLSATGFIASTLLFLPNWLPFALSFPVLLWLCGYSYAKRFTSLAHYWLGVALGLSPVAAWIAIRGEQVLASPADLLPATVLGAAVLAWVAGFDILYACQDYEYDKSVGLHSLPAKLGLRGALRLAAASHAVAAVLLALLPTVYPPLGTLWWCGIAAVAALLIYEHRLVRPDDLDRVNLAFFHVNAVISLGLLAVGTLDLVF